jgi:hypothetical protein
MRNLMIIAAVVILTANASAVLPPWVGPGAVVEIPVVMDIEPVASIALNDAVIKLEPVSGSLDYTGVTLPPNQPVLTCNVPVTVSAYTTGVAPLVSLLWATALQGQPWSVPGNPCGGTAINVDPPATPFILDVAVWAQLVDMTVRPQGLNARVATTTVTVVPRP